MTNGGVAASPGTANRQAASTAITTKRMRNRLIQRGQRILYGASGTSAPPGVQLAKHFEAHVTAVCNTTRPLVPVAAGGRGDEVYRDRAEEGAVVLTDRPLRCSYLALPA
jgi:hypothetical protein